MKIICEILIQIVNPCQQIVQLLHLGLAKLYRAFRRAFLYTENKSFEGTIMLKHILLTVLLSTIPFCGLADNTVKTRPRDFVDAKQIIPQLQTDIRYDSEHNFIGRKIQGYEAPLCLLTQKSAEALKTVQTQLLAMGLSLKVYDCYRPQTAVDDFVQWATEVNNTRMRTEFYPAVDKKDLFKEGYIAEQSEHSRGSTVDLTIVPLNSEIPPYNPWVKQVACTAPQAQRSADNSLDFGTGYDCFSPVSHPDYSDLSAQQKANRLLLQTLMKNAGFAPLDTEWWHFTLVDQPYPHTIFDFPVK